MIPIFIGKRPITEYIENVQSQINFGRSFHLQLLSMFSVHGKSASRTSFLASVSLLGRLPRR